MLKVGIILLNVMLIVLLGGCSSDVSEMVMGPDMQEGGSNQKAEGDDAAGNNLSFPVIWSDGYALSLPNTYGVELFDGIYTEVPDEDGVLVPIYHQKDELNQWQAQSAAWTEAVPLAVDWVDWGDNIESKSWPIRSKIRVETVLFQDLVEPMLGYEMVWVSGLGVDEVWGTNGLTENSLQATVYSHNARLTIQKLPDDDEAAIMWNRDLHEWTLADGSEYGTPYADPVWNSVVYESGDGPMNGYSAEINVKGRVIYGMLWDTRVDADGLGFYRITFSFDHDGSVGLNTMFDAGSTVVPPAEGEEEGEKAEPVGGVAVIDPELNLTYIDVEITQRGGGGGGGGRDNPPGGGGGGGGGHH